MYIINLKTKEAKQIVLDGLTSKGFNSSDALGAPGLQCLTCQSKELAESIKSAFPDYVKSVELLDPSRPVLCHQQNSWHDYTQDVHNTEVMVAEVVPNPNAPRGRNVDIVIVEYSDLNDSLIHFGDPDNIEVSRLTDVNWTAFGNEGMEFPNAASPYEKVFSSSNENFAHAAESASVAAGTFTGLANKANVYMVNAEALRGTVAFWQAFACIKNWHESKAVNPDTGVVNPTVVNISIGRNFAEQRVVSNFGASSAIIIGSSVSGVKIRGQNFETASVENLLEILDSGNLKPIVSAFDTDTAFARSEVHISTGASDVPTQSQILLDDLVNTSGVFVFSSAGNSAAYIAVSGDADWDNEAWVNGNVSYPHRGAGPANSSGVFSVGALSPQAGGGMDAYSCWGPGVDFFAPGHLTLSYNNRADGGLLNATYSVFGGTSSASPHLAGLAACYLETNPSASRQDVYNWLDSNSEVITDPERQTNIKAPKYPWVSGVSTFKRRVLSENKSLDSYNGISPCSVQYDSFAPFHSKVSSGNDGTQSQNISNLNSFRYDYSVVSDKWWIGAATGLAGCAVMSPGFVDPSDYSLDRICILKHDPNILRSYDPEGLNAPEDQVFSYLESRFILDDYNSEGRIGIIADYTDSQNYIGGELSVASGVGSTVSIYEVVAGAKTVRNTVTLTAQQEINFKGNGIINRPYRGYMVLIVQDNAAGRVYQFRVLGADSAQHNATIWQGEANVPTSGRFGFYAGGGQCFDNTLASNGNERGVTAMFIHTFVRANR